MTKSKKIGEKSHKNVNLGEKDTKIQHLVTKSHKLV